MTAKRKYAQIKRGPLGSLIFARRKVLHLTQDELARRLHTSRPWVSNVETGKVKLIQFDELAALAAALGLPQELVEHRYEKTTNAEPGDPEVNDLKTLTAEIRVLREEIAGLREDMRRDSNLSADEKLDRIAAECERATNG